MLCTVVHKIKYGASPTKVIQGSPGSVSSTPAATPTMSPIVTIPADGDIITSASPASTALPVASRASGFDFTAILATIDLALFGSLAYTRIRK